MIDRPWHSGPSLTKAPPKPAPRATAHLSGPASRTKHVTPVPPTYPLNRSALPTATWSLQAHPTAQAKKLRIGRRPHFFAVTCRRVFCSYIFLPASWTCRPSSHLNHSSSSKLRHHRQTSTQHPSTTQRSRIWSQYQTHLPYLNTDLNTRTRVPSQPSRWRFTTVWYVFTTAFDVVSSAMPLDRTRA